MNWSAFEKHVRDTLHTREEALDTNQLIAKLFQEEKKKKVYPWWWIFAGLVSAGILLWLLYPVTQRQSPHHIVAENTVELNKNVQAANQTDEMKSAFHASRDQDETAEEKTTLTVSINKVKRSLPVSDNTINTNNQQSAIYPEENDVDESRTDLPQAGYPVFELPVHVGSTASMFPPRFPKRKVECPTFSNRKRITFFLQPEAGYAMPQKTLESAGSEITDVIRSRMDHEKTLEGLQAALYLGMNIGRSPFYVKTGLAYTRISEKLDLQYEYTRQDTTYGIISITKSQTGDTLTVIYGDIITQSTIEGRQVKHHYFHLLDIPLCVGYQFLVFPKWSLNAEVGLVLNAGMRASGEVLASRSDFLPAARENYQPSLGLGYRAGIDVEYTLSPVLGLGLQARINGYSKNFSSANADFRQSYLVPGAQLYMKYYFTN